MKYKVIMTLEVTVNVKADSDQEAVDKAKLSIVDGFENVSVNISEVIFDGPPVEEDDSKKNAE